MASMPPLLAIARSIFPSAFQSPGDDCSRILSAPGTDRWSRCC